MSCNLEYCSGNSRGVILFFHWQPVCVSVELILIHTIFEGSNSKRVPIRDDYSRLLLLLWDNPMCSIFFDCRKRSKCLEIKAWYWTSLYRLFSKHISYCNLSKKNVTRIPTFTLSRAYSLMWKLQKENKKIGLKNYRAESWHGKCYIMEQAHGSIKMGVCVAFIFI